MAAPTITSGSMSDTSSDLRSWPNARNGRAMRGSRANSVTRPCFRSKIYNVGGEATDRGPGPISLLKSIRSGSTRGLSVGELLQQLQRFAHVPFGGSVARAREYDPRTTGARRDRRLRARDRPPILKCFRERRRIADAGESGARGGVSGNRWTPLGVVRRARRVGLRFGPFRQSL